MSEAMDRAHETIHQHADHDDGRARGIGVLVSVLAAALAVTEIAEKTSQNAYLSEHIALSNDWAFYQAKNQRSIIRTTEAEVLASLPDAANPVVQARIQQAQAYAARMQDDPTAGDGMKQLAEQAHAREVERDEYAHRYHGYEYAVGVIELAIVLASVSVVTRMRAMSIGAGVVGIAAITAAAGIALHLL